MANCKSLNDINAEAYLLSKPLFIRGFLEHYCY